MKKLSTLVILSLIQLYNRSTSLALSTHSSSGSSSISSRSAFLKKHILTCCSSSAAAAAAAAVLLTPSISNAAAIEQTNGKILKSEKCAYGEGEGCSSLAGDNEFIKELQRRSKERKESAQKVCTVHCILLFFHSL